MIPLGTDRLSKKTPITTVSLIVLNVLIFLVTSLGVNAGSALAAAMMDAGVFQPGLRPLLAQPWTLVSYAFLHDPSGLSHVAFNMLFLWVFGGAVEGRLGSWWFALFYLSGAMVAALGEWLIDPAPMIGASGAVAAVTGAFAALCPRARVRILFFFSIIEIPGLVLVLVFAGIDLLGQIGNSFSGTGGVAYSAHLVGYAMGMTTMVALLGLQVLPRTEFDLFFLIKQSHRRRAMRAAFNQRGSPWVKDAAQNTATTRDSGPAAAPRPMSLAEEAAALSDASARWSRGEFASAAAAWERFARRSPTHPQAAEALLLAAVTHARRLDASDRARDILGALLTLHPAPSDATLEQARALLGELDQRGTP